MDSYIYEFILNFNIGRSSVAGFTTRLLHPSKASPGLIKQKAGWAPNFILFFQRIYKYTGCRYIQVKVKVKQSHCRPGQALRFPEV
jgi:hypothetical protein